MPSRLTALGTATLMATSLLVAPTTPAFAETVDRAGFSTSKPKQRSGSAADRKHTATAAETSVGKDNGRPKLPKVAGAIGEQVTHPDPAYPKQAGGNQKAELKSVPGPQKPGVRPDSKEDPGKRTPNSKVFTNPDGSKTLRVFNGTVHVRANDGSLVPVDGSLVPDGSGRHQPKAAAAVTVANTANDTALASLDLGDGTAVSFAVDDANPVTGVVAGDTIRYGNSRRNADVVLTAASWGLKEDLVLHNADAPTSWRFPLNVRGVEPRVDAGTGDVLFVDRSGGIRAVIPHGFMVDSNINPASGDGVTSTGVTYALDRTDGTWVLRVDLDADWLRDPARKFPVTVDPTLRKFATETDDTFVSSRDYKDSTTPASMSEIRVGTYDGTEKSAPYLHFNAAMAALTNRYIIGATLNLYNTHSYNCPGSPTPVSVYRVTQPWSGSTTKGWPGPAYDAGNAVASGSFAYGHDSCSADQWVSFGIDAKRMTNWVHGVEPFYGLTLRASDTHVGGWKKFSSGNATNGATPFLDVNYAEEGATYALPNGGFDPAVTAVSSGKVLVRVTNWGSSTWTPDGPFTLTAKVLNPDGSQRFYKTDIRFTGNVAPHQSGDVWVEVPAMPIGRYTLQLDMLQTGYGPFSWGHGTPMGTASFDVVNAAPVVSNHYPRNNGTVDTLRPTLWAGVTDTDGGVGARRYSFRLCTGTPAAPTNCHNSGWIASATWRAPAGALTWGIGAFFYAAAGDGSGDGPQTGPVHFTPQVSQPEITSRLAGGGDDIDLPGLSPLVGNYTTSATDAAVPVVGPSLDVRRTYNSQDPRTDGAFGAGWSTPLDQRIVVDGDGSGNVVVTLASGRTVRFGRNPDGSYASPLGQNLTLVQAADGSWTMRDPSGVRRMFNAQGRLVSTVDVDGQAQHLQYGSDGQVVRLQDVTSGRSITVAWTGSHVTSVSTDAPVSGDPQPTWTYQYNGDRLVAACTPLSSTACARYDYVESSHYRSLIIDANPAAYWPLGQTADGTTGNVVARTPGEFNATVHHVGHQAPGAFTGSTDNATGFDATKPSTMSLPAGLVDTSVAMAVELWIKVDGGKHGVLLSQQDTAVGTAPTRYVPALYVGTDGTLRGGLWTSQGPARLTAGRVDDGAWHHVVLSAAVDTQTLYVDGVPAAQAAGVIDHTGLTVAQVGTGYTDTTYPATLSSTGAFAFTGTIDDVAVYRRPLDAVQAASHHQARAATSRLSKAVHAAGNPIAEVGYDTTSGRVRSVVDKHGATWTLEPTVVETNNQRGVSLFSSARSAGIYYQYDTSAGGRLAYYTDGTRAHFWKYNAAGFLSEEGDDGGFSRYGAYATDARGNVLAHTTCYTTEQCQTRHFTYFLNTSNGLDPRNDVMLTATDGRGTGASDATYRTTYEINAAGRITHIIRGGTQANPHDEYLHYSTGTEAAIGGGTIPAGLVLTHEGTPTSFTRYGYNADGDQITETNALWLRTTRTVDNIGRTVAVARASYTPDGVLVTDYGTTTTTYNAVSQPLTTTIPAVINPVTGVTHTSRTTNAYDPAGRLTSTTVEDTTGGDTARTWQHTYDARGRLDSTTTPDGLTHTQTWDARGDTTRITNPAGLATEYRFNDRHQLIETTAVGAGVDPENPTATRLVTESRAYDPFGRLASAVDAAGRETGYRYYADGSLAEQRHTRRDAGGAVTDSPLLAGYTYDQAGNLLTTTDAAGALTVYTYDARSRRTSDTFDPTGLARRVTYEYHASDVLMAERRTGAPTPWVEEVTSYHYNNAKQVDSITVATGPGAGIVTQYDYDARGLRTGIADPASGHTAYRYNNLDQLETIDEPARTTWTGGVKADNIQPRTVLGYNTFGEPTHQRNPAGAVTTTTVDTMGRVTAVAQPTYTPPGGNPIQAVTRTRYTNAGLPAEVTDALERTTRYQYDIYGRTTKVVQPDPDGDLVKTAPVWTYRYDRVGQLLETVDPTGASVSTTYNDMGYAVTEAQSDRTDGTTKYAITNRTFDNAGNPTSVTSPLNHTTRIEYNPAREATKITDPTSQVITFGYDLGGRLASKTLAGTRATTYDYDLVGRLTAEHDHVVNPDGGLSWAYRHRYNAYDAGGRLAKTTSAEGRVTTYGYDQAGQQISIGTLKDPNDPASTVSVQLGYDINGQRTHTVDGNGNATDVTHNPWGLLESTIEPATAAHPDPADRTWTTTYDAAGQDVRIQLPGGVTRQRTFDNLGRLTEETGTGAEATTTARHLHHDPIGRLVRVSGPGEEFTASYTDRGELATTNGAAGRTTYTYDADGNLTNRTDPTGTSTFTYDPAGRLATAFDPLTTTTATYSYAGTGDLTKISHGDGAATRTFGYDVLGRLTNDRWNTAGGNTTASTSYAWDNDDLLTSKTAIGFVGGGANTYRYDGLARLTGWTRPDGQRVSYGYDNASNRTTITNPDGTRTTSYDARNRAITATGAGHAYQTWTWTARGTLATLDDGGRTTRHTYDAFERLVNVHNPDQTTITYTYDALDRLVQRNGAEHHYTNLTNQPVSVPTVDGPALIFRNPDGTPASTKTGTANGRILLTDRVHQDVMAAADPHTGDIAASTSYEPYGEPAGLTGVLPLGYQGGYSDPTTGNVNAHARWYTPSTGTFTSRDTWTLEPDPVAQTNRQLYANGSPITNVDINGHSSGIGLLVRTGVRAAERVAGKPKPTKPGIKPAPGNDGCGLWSGGECRYVRPLPGRSPKASGTGSGSSTSNENAAAARIEADQWAGRAVVLAAQANARSASAPPGSTTGKTGKGTTRGKSSSSRNAGVGRGAGSNNEPRTPKRPTDWKSVVTAASWSVRAAVEGDLGTIANLPGHKTQPRPGIVEDIDPETALPANQVDDRDRCLGGPAFKDYFDLDDQDRATGAHACFAGGQPIPAGQTATLKPPGYQHGQRMDRGHLLAKSLGGEDKYENLVPLYHYANTAMYNYAESYVRPRVENGEDIYILVYPTYEGDNPVPAKVTVLIFGSNEPAIGRVFNNVRA